MTDSCTEFQFLTASDNLSLVEVLGYSPRVAVTYRAQPPGVHFCCVLIADGDVYMGGSLRRSGMIMSGRNDDFLIIRGTR